MKEFADIERTKEHILEAHACIVHGFTQHDVLEDSLVLVRLCNKRQESEKEYTVDHNEVISRDVITVNVQRDIREHEKVSAFKRSYQNYLFLTSEQTKQSQLALTPEKMKALLSIHSNLTAIDVCTVKSKRLGKEITTMMCIVLYCYAKGLVPIGEPLFPTKLVTSKRTYENVIRFFTDRQTTTTH